MKWNKHITTKIVEELEWGNDSVISIEPICTSIEIFEVKLHFAEYSVMLGVFESSAEAKKFVKNGQNEINNIVKYLNKIKTEIRTLNLPL